MWKVLLGDGDFAFVYIRLQTCRKMSILVADVHVLIR